MSGIVIKTAGIMFCLSGICLVLTVSFALYANKTLERSHDLLSFAFDLLHRQDNVLHRQLNVIRDKAYQAAYDNGYKDAVKEVFILRNPVFADNNTATDDTTDTTDSTVNTPEGTD